MKRSSLMPLLAVALVGSACTTDIEVEDLPATVVSVGPAWVADDVLYVEFRSWDHEGDDVSLELLVGETVGAMAPVSPERLAPYSLTNLPSERMVETTGLVGMALAGEPVPAHVGVRVAGQPQTALAIATPAR